MVENMFKKGYAQSLILRTATSDGSKGEAVGLALVRVFSLSSREEGR